MLVALAIAAMGKDYEPRNKEKFKSRIKRLVVKIIGIKNYSRIKKLVHKEREKNEV